MSGNAQLGRGGRGRRAPDRQSRPIVLGIIAFAVLVLSAIWATAILLAERERDAVYASARAELTGAQATLAAHIGRTFEAAMAIQSSIDHWLGEHSARTPLPDLLDLDSYVLRLQRHHERPVLVRLVDGAGRMIHPKLPDGRIVAFSDREHFLGIRGKPAGAIHIGTPVTSRITNQQLIPVMMSAHPNSFGVDYILVGIPVAPIADAYRDLLITAPGTSGVLREDGMVLFRAPDPDGLTGTQHPRLSFAELFAHQRSVGVVEGVIEIDGPPMNERRLVAYRRLDPLPLATYSGFATADLEANGRQRMYLPLGAAVVATLVTVAITLWLAGMASRREAEARRLHDALSDARQASRAKTDFLANMSHELRTPLNAILGMSEMVDGALLGPLPAKYRDYARDIGRSGRHLLGLIEQILDIAQIEKGTIRPEPELVDVHEALDAVQPLLAPRLAEGRIVLALDLPADLPQLYVDPRMFRQMLLCVLGNAVRYAGPGARVTVMAAAGAQGLSLSMADNGRGIPAETLAHIFEPFGRNNSSVARQDGGLGLGLPTVKSMMELHGGWIDIATAPGRGTAVTLFFPPGAVPPISAVKRSA